jgi:hypothetical protein
MAVAFGIEYGLADIAQANAAITRELEAQKRIYDDLSARARGLGYGAKTPYALGAGQAVDSNVIDRRFDEKVDAAIDKRIRKTFDRQAGRAGGTSAVGIGRDMNDILELASGRIGYRSLRGGLDTFEQVLPKKVRGITEKVSSTLPLLGAASAITYSILELGDMLSKADQTTTDSIDKSNRSYKHLRDQLKSLGVHLDPNKIQPIKLPPQPGEDESFEEQTRRSAEFADRFYRASSQMLSEDPNAVSTFMPARNGRKMNRTMIRDMIEDAWKYGNLADVERIVRTGEYMSKTLTQSRKLERKQAELFERDPELAARNHERERAMKREERQQAKELRDWSRS